jgi:broad specificity phosphatase PhoE
MTTMTRVHLLRHGEVHNPEGVLYGRLPGYRLSQRGQAMAQRVAEYVADWDVVHLVSSPLERAQETAAPTAHRFGLDVHIDERIIEAGNRLEGLDVGVGDGVLRRPNTWRLLWNPFRPSWGEPYVQIAARMRAAVADAARAAHGHDALLVSHQLPIWTLRSDVEDRRLWHDPRKRQCNLASITTFVHADDEIVAVVYAEPAADLLPGATTTPGA